MKKYLFMVLVFININAYSQDTLDLLKGKEWQKVYLEDCVEVIENNWCHMFTDSQFFHLLGFGSNECMPCPYYLSDKKDKVFDKSKVGKVKNGKYAIIYNFNWEGDRKKPKIMEIKKLADDELIFEFNGNIYNLKSFKAKKKSDTKPAIIVYDLKRLLDEL